MANEKTEQVKGSTGNRYSEDKKKEILEFFKSKNGERGATSETLNKFGISYIALRSWLGAKEKKSATKGKAGRPAKTTPKEQKEEGNAKRGRKANPSIAFLRVLEKMKNQHEKALSQINKTIEKVSVK